MIQKLDLNENLINKINYSLSFSLNNEILSVERVSYEPLWRKIVFTGLFVIPTTCFLLTTLYCIYAIIVDAILITLICLTAIPSINSLYSSKSSLDNSQYSFMSFFVSKKIQLENRKPILTLEIYDSMVGGILEGKIRIPRKRKLLPWDIHIFLFQKITYPSKEIAYENAHMIKDYISKNSNSLFKKIKIEN